MARHTPRADVATPQDRKDPPGTVRCLECRERFVVVPDRWGCPHCGGTVSRKVGTSWGEPILEVPRNELDRAAR